MSEYLLLNSRRRYTMTLEFFSPLIDLARTALEGRKNSVVLEREEQAERKFAALSRDWKEKSVLMSSVADMVSLTSYQEIIAMKGRAIPLLLRELRDDPNHWFAALVAITGENPVASADRGNLDKMVDTWLRWGRDRGYCI